MRLLAAAVTLVVSAGVLIAGVNLRPSSLAAQQDGPERVIVADVDYLGRAIVAVGQFSSGMEIGGLSAITYDATADRYYVLTDDRSERAPARFYTVALAIGDGSLAPGDVVFEGATTLLDADGLPYPAGEIDPEGIALSAQGTVFVSSEGALANQPPINPSISEYGLGGQQIRELSLPAKYLPNGSDTVGVRSNLALESLTFAPDARFMTTAVENALRQDGPEADADTASLSRVLTLDVLTGQPVMETVYPVGPASAPVSPEIPEGLVEMAALDNNGTFLSLERGPSTGIGLAVRLYQSRSQGALDVRAVDSLALPGEEDATYEIDPPVIKELLLDFADLGLPFVNNYEGMTLGPVLPDGRQTLILVSDNNFSAVPTEFMALALTLETVPTTIASLETPLTQDTAVAPEGVIAGAATDPAIWVHPTNPQQSLVAVMLRDGGLMTLDLQGEQVQMLSPTTYGDVGYYSADVIYNFPLGSQAADVLVVSDRRNDTLRVFRIDPATRLLADITSPTMPAPLFGVDDGVQTAYGLATYTSPRSGKPYAFVTQAAGNQVAQVSLTAAAGGLVTGSVVRTLVLPGPLDDPAAAQAEGIVADRLLSNLYVGLRSGEIVKFGAEPDAGDGHTLVPSSPGDLRPPLGGLSLYYGAGGAGYLLAANQGDHTYAVFERGGNNAAVGSFVIAGEGDIDQSNASVGIDVINVPLGPSFPEGLLVVQDGANDPQNAIADGQTLRNNSSNFKYIAWESVSGAFPEGLLVDPNGFNPRRLTRALLPVIMGE